MSAKTLHEQALEDVEQVRQVAIENARNVLVEAIVPKIKEVVASQLGETDMALEVGDASDEDQMKDADAEMKEAGVYEADEQEDAEESDEEETEEVKEQQMNLEADEKAADEKEEEMEEVVRVSESDLREAFREIVKSELAEAAVTKGFGDVADAEDGGIADKKSGEAAWNDVEPPAAEDMTVKEAKQKIAALTKENADLRKAYAVLKKNLQEVHVFNSKLLYTNKLINKTGLSNKQRLAVIEAFDRATSLREVELVYKSLSESLPKIAGGVVNEAKDLKGPKASRTVKPSSTLLKEAVEKDSETENRFDYWTRLAGLAK